MVLVDFFLLVLLFSVLVISSFLLRIREEVGEREGKCERGWKVRERSERGRERGGRKRRERGRKSERGRMKVRRNKRGRRRRRNKARKNI